MVRLTGIYTRIGDGGETSLGDGSRVKKSASRVAAYGTVDEANAAIGLARVSASAKVEAALARIQNDLFDLGADVSVPETSKRVDGALRVLATQVTRLEREIDALNACLKPLDSFVLPGGSPCGAHLHFARHGGTPGRAAGGRARRRGADQSRSAPVSQPPLRSPVRVEPPCQPPGCLGRTVAPRRQLLERAIQTAEVRVLGCIPARERPSRPGSVDETPSAKPTQCGRSFSRLHRHRRADSDIHPAFATVPKTRSKLTELKPVSLDATVLLRFTCAHGVGDSSLVATCTVRPQSVVAKSKQVVQDVVSSMETVPCLLLAIRFFETGVINRPSLASRGRHAYEAWIARISILAGGPRDRIR
jgi:cob(I)alamin adenosyltransferase